MVQKRHSRLQNELYLIEIGRHSAALCYYKVQKRAKRSFREKCVQSLYFMFLNMLWVWWDQKQTPRNNTCYCYPFI